MPFFAGMQSLAIQHDPALESCSLSSHFGQIFSSGIFPASEFLSALTNTLTRIDLSPYFFRSAGVGTRALTITTNEAGEIDTRPDFFSKDKLPA